ncbi:polyadenylate-binding protein-interacting protein 1 isoform X2 [Belonocnema kinseyi]|uniref:polyadenylate-binding protein-interacting protein 1 isoform X2 n=1 Tax=Belonocnema kinseyi TaxID=2817044 RepID=UPI00143D3D00|nr:polyadenylate-binding protein-interacting protein 1 isoform X2 [Belonocnema kinseyi]
MDNYGADGSGDGNNSNRGAGRGRGRGSWASGRQEPHFLRRPHSAAPAPATENAGVAEVVKNSKLSAEAAEFVPQSFSPAPAPAQPQGWVRHSIQDRLQIVRQGQSLGQRHQGSHGMHQQHMQYVIQQPHGQQMYQQYGEMPQYQGYNQQQGGQDFGYYDGGSGDYSDKHQSSRRETNNHSSDYEGTLRHLDHVMKSLTMNPGRFDALVTRIVNSVKPYLDQPSQSQQIASMIIQQSINETNFRYSGARLCTSLVAATSTSIFKDTLLTRCQEQTQSFSSAWQETTKHSDDEEKKCHGMILFLAELVIQMESSIAVALGKLLVQLISAVLQSPAQNSAKNICQALKLAGQTLESDSSSKKDMEQVMQKLTKLVTEGRVDSHVGRMVQGVNNLRSENWGNSVKTEPDTNSTSTTPQSDEPVFYGPDGTVLSAEESKFLQDLAEANPEIEEDTELENEADKWEDEEEEIIVTAAFEEFLNLSNRR